MKHIMNIVADQAILALLFNYGNCLCLRGIFYYCFGGKCLLCVLGLFWERRTRLELQKQLWTRDPRQPSECQAANSSIAGETWPTLSMFTADLRVCMHRAYPGSRPGQLKQLEFNAFMWALSPARLWLHVCLTIASNIFSAVSQQPRRSYSIWREWSVPRISMPPPAERYRGSYREAAGRKCHAGRAMRTTSTSQTEKPNKMG